MSVVLLCECSIVLSSASLFLSSLSNTSHLSSSSSASRSILADCGGARLRLRREDRSGIMNWFSTADDYIIVAVCLFEDLANRRTCPNSDLS